MGQVSDREITGKEKGKVGGPEGIFPAQSSKPQRRASAPPNVRGAGPFSAPPVGLHCHGNGSATATVALHRASATPTTAHSRAPGRLLRASSPRCSLELSPGLPPTATASRSHSPRCAATRSAALRLLSPSRPCLPDGSLQQRQRPGARLNAALHAGAQVLVRWLGPAGGKR